jgi:hypothetical protein
MKLENAAKYYKNKKGEIDKKKIYLTTLLL